MKLKLIQTLAIFSIIVLFGCSEPSFSQNITGTWSSIDYSGSTLPEGAHVNMQLDINKNGDVNVIATIEYNGETTIKRRKGKVEGAYIIFDKTDVNKVTLSGKTLSVENVKDKITVSYEKI